MELADVVKSLRLHWRVSVAIVLLTGAFFAAFLVTRNQVQPDDRYEVGVQILVPTRNKAGERPEGVPPQLMQGQSTKALSQSTKDAALRRANIPEDRRGSISFRFSQNEKGDIITLSATANDPSTAKKVALGFRSAYVATRRDTMAQGLTTKARSSRSALGRLLARLGQVNKAIRDADPDLANSLPVAPSSNAGDVVRRLPVTTPLDTILLVVEHQKLLSVILNTELSYAESLTGSITPSSFATTVETLAARQITPPLPSPVVPAAVFLAIGFALALVAPILMDRLDRSIRTAKTAAIAFDSVVLTSVPAASRKVQRAIAAPGTPWDGAYRALAATSIATDRLPRAILVTSPTGMVQDTVAANFAASLAGLGLRVALVGTDARQNWFLDMSEPVEARLSFPELLEMAHAGRLDGALPRGLVPTRLDNLLVMPPGETDREVSLDGLGPLLEALSTSGVDVTVIAGPALLEDPNATILAWITRSVLWAFETGDVTEAEAKEAASRLALAGASSFGVAMVNAKT